ncbi:cytochrome c [Geomonas limicola]|uniref:Cytochrome c n=1 Tax=Geomonas limicola TaxID=2740186 RepID=A0A6V8N2E7_9BACT|nr:CxxxxCH/CxxCH domain-containing protein [Geomonas limicola]GFO66581.1 cytochrome c [Geomonas limicola]
MNNVVFKTLVLGMLCLLAPLTAGAVVVDSPHGSADGYSCTNCHTGHITLGSTGFNNICLTCHRPGVAVSGRKPFAPGDAADPFGLYTTTSPQRLYQTSHRWDGLDTAPWAGAQPPVFASMTGVRGRTGAQMACVRCHNQHDNSLPPFLRMANDQDQMCLDCHRSRNQRNHASGTHPVNFVYGGADSKAVLRPAEYFNPPVNANPANASSNLAAKFKGGKLVCSTCHGVHYADSSSATFDSYSSSNGLKKGDGYLLRTDLRGPQVAIGAPDNSNICLNCHAGKKNHNNHGQDVQCTDCHGAHVDPGNGSAPNSFLIWRYMNISSFAGKVRNKPVFSSATSIMSANFKDPNGTGICQACHVVPAGVAPAHDLPSAQARDCVVCHNHNSQVGSFSGGCTSCHGYPITANRIGGPDGLAAPATGALGASPASAGAHATHVTARSIQCLACHNGYTTTQMGNGKIEMGFGVTPQTWSGFQSQVTTGTIYVNSSLNAGYSWSAQAGTTLNQAPGQAISCSIYCHGSTLSGGSTTRPQWTGSGQALCGSCHGASATTPPTTGGHLRHAGSGATGLALACASCHGSPGATGHVDGSVSWNLSPLTPQGGAAQYRSLTVGTTGQPAPSASYGQCSNLYCHGGKAVTWGGPALPADCSGCHGGLTTGPDYANGSPKANSHAKHVVTNGLTCNLCHSSVVDASGAIVNRALHVDQVYEVLQGGSASFSVSVAGNASTATQCSNISCHGGTGTTATWGQSLNCQDCHSAASDLDNFSGSFWNNGIVGKVSSSEWLSTGHGASAAYRSGNPGANFGRNGNPRQCEFCHDSNVAHKLSGNPFRLLNYSSAAWGRNQVCQSCHAPGATGVSANGSLISSSLKIGSAHLGAKHGAANSGGQFCWDCHDAHGDGNDYMMHTQVAKSSDRSSGAPTATVAVSFTLATPGATAWSDFVKPGPAFNGICQACHTSTAHFTASSYDATHNPGGSCVACHNHTGSGKNLAFEPGGACDTCHGYPPAPRKVTGSLSFGVQGSWSSARFEDYSGGGGAHLVAGHIPKSANASQGWSNCLPCHNGGSASHTTAQPLRSHVENVTVKIDQQLRFSNDVQAIYSSARLTSGGTNKSGSCFNVACHFAPTPKWSIER